jgi:hypothetical protein
MKFITEKLTEILSEQNLKSLESKKIKEVEQLLEEMKRTGLLKTPVYNLPLVDTIGKTYYSTTNKR